jgi:hypothetical protein
MGRRRRGGAPADRGEQALHTKPSPNHRTGAQVQTYGLVLTAPGSDRLRQKRRKFATLLSEVLLSGWYDVLRDSRLNQRFGKIEVTFLAFPG